MKIYAAKDYNDLSRKAANIISAQVIIKSHSCLGLATGSTPIGTYKQLIEWYQKGDIDFSQTRTVNLDEYQGLSASHDQSYRYFMNVNLFKHINIDLQNTHVPNGLCDDPLIECKRYNTVIKQQGGIDLQLLGIGSNGHIGFNEPGAAFEKETHLVTLSQNTRENNARFFSSIDEVPTHAFTMGIKNIMSAKKILLLATGANKASALFDSFFGPVTPLVPASILQLHNDVTIIADEEALSIIRTSTGWQDSIYDNQ